MKRFAALLTVLLALSACASGPAPTDPRDPYEATNRDILEFNLRVDRAVIRPVAVFYRDNVGQWTRDRVRNVFSNVQEPVYAINHLLQGKPVAAGTSTMRFVINTVGGIGGIFDLAPIGGPPRDETGFGETLYVWGLPDGPYLMVPITGPSNPRDLAGTVVDGLMNPIAYLLPTGASIGRAVGNGIELRSRNIETLDELQASSIDFYARLRSLSRQLRDRELGRTANGAIDVLDDPGSPADPAQPPPPAPGVPPPR